MSSARNARVSFLGAIGDGCDPAVAGRSIGRFQIIREIGRGAAAVVYEAQDTQLHRPVALKVLAVGANLTGEARRQAIERFYREARSAGKLSHPNIAQIYDVGQDGGQHYIAMELCQGVTLRDILRFEGRISESRLKGISIQISNALEAAHAVRIIPRDTTPDNIIIG
ncbi:MAG: serine/threonine protein kinase, partial [Armatimonadetes bacterium]|nr:serine/threonine protein kinase [Armatimonadota bacterium]